MLTSTNSLVMMALFILGCTFVVQGLYYIYQKHRDNLPAKMYVIGILSILVGFMAFAFAIISYLMT